MDKQNKKENDYYTDDDYLDLTGTSSATDCTGLIPEGSNHSDSVRLYNDLYQFGVPHVAAKATEKSSAKATDKSAAKTTNKSSNTSKDKKSY